MWPVNLIPARFIRPYEHNGQRLDMYKGSIFAGRAPNPAQTFWGKCCRVKYAKESWKKSGIGNKSIENGSAGLFVYKAYLITGFLQIYHYDFFLSFIKAVILFPSTANYSFVWLWIILWRQVGSYSLKRSSRMLANVCQLRDRCVTLQSVVPLEATQKNWEYIQLKYLSDYSSLYSLNITNLLLAIISPHRQTIIAGIYSN